MPFELSQASKLEALHLPVRANEVLAERLEALCFVANSPKASVQQLDQPETAEQWNDAFAQAEPMAPHRLAVRPV